METSRQEQIQELSEILEDAKTKALGTIGSQNYGFGFWYATAVYNSGYRKQNEGEWIDKRCSVCGGRQPYTAGGTNFATTYYQFKSKYCPNCGVKMKGNKK